MKLEGVITALVTPFTESGAVDEDGLRSNIRFQLERGVDGILPLGTTGETPCLTGDECDLVLRVAVEEAKGKVPILAGTGSNSTVKTVEATRRACDLGADCALVVTPYYNKPTQDGIVAHFEAAAGASDLPVLVYNIQGRTGTNIETSTLERIAGIPGILGVKEASGRIGQMGDVIARIQSRREGFAVLSGDDALTLPLLALGGRGVVSVISNLVPELVRDLVRAGLSGDFETARTLHYRLLTLVEVAFIESNPIPIKAAMDRCGLAGGNVRLPLTPIRPEHLARVEAVLDELELTAR